MFKSHLKYVYIMVKIAGRLLSSKRKICPHSCWFGPLPCKWWRCVEYRDVTRRWQPMCVIAICNASSRSLYSLPKKMLRWGQSRKNRIHPSIFRWPSGVRSRFYTGALWKEAAMQGQIYLFIFIFLISGLMKQVSSLVILGSLKTSLNAMPLSPTATNWSQSVLWFLQLGNWNCCSWSGGVHLAASSAV